MKQRTVAVFLVLAMMLGIHPAALSEGETAEPAPTPAASAESAPTQEPTSTPVIEATPAPAAEPTPTPEAEEGPNMEQDVTPSPEVSETPAPDAEGEPTPTPSLAVGEVPNYLSGSETILATGSCGTQAIYTLYGDGKLVISGKGSVTSAPWLSTVNGISYKNAVTAVVVKEGITSLQKGFQGCSNLASITMPASVTKLWTYVFQYNSLIKTAGPIGGGYDYEFAWTDTIAEGAFMYIGSLESVVIPDTVTSIGGSAFHGCALKEIDLPEGLLTIGDSAFSSTALTSITIPEGVTGISHWAFSGCKSLSSITLPEGIEWIGAGAFGSCTALQTISLPSTVNQIYNDAFGGCTALKSITIPAAVTKIGSRAFKNCTAMKEVLFLGNAPAIGEEAFYDVEATVKYYTNKTWTSDDMDQYDGYLTWTAVSPTQIASGKCGTNATWVLYSTGELIISGSGAIYDYTTSSKAPWSSYNTSIKSITVGGSISTIGQCAFASCVAATSLKLPTSLRTISFSAFTGCNALRSVTLPSGVTTIGQNAFGGCSKLSYFYIPATVTDMFYDAFSGCSSLKSVGPVGSGCNIIYAHSGTKLNNLGFEGASIESFTYPEGATSSPSTFKKSSLKKIVLPATLMSAKYLFQDVSGIKTAGPIGSGCNVEYAWENLPENAFGYANKLESVIIPDTVTSIGKQAFEGCSALKTVSGANKVTTIGQSAFSGCSALKDITLASTVTSIGYGAFSGCTAITSMGPVGGEYDMKLDFSGVTPRVSFDDLTGLKTLVIPNGITTFKCTYNGCAALEKVVIPGSVTAMEESYEQLPDGTYGYIGPFSACPKLKSAGPIGGGYPVEFDSVTKIPSNAFYRSPYLESAVVPEGVTHIGSSAFAVCENLTSLSLPSTLSIIGTDAFACCTGLSELMLPESLTSIGDNAFNGLGYDVYSGTEGMTVTIPASVTRIGKYCFESSKIKELTFLGDAPAIGTDAFKGMTATAYYNSSKDWTADDCQQYGGTITWVGRLMGDADEDGSITVLDAILVAKHAASLKTLTGTAFEKADMNGDGALTAADAVLISAAAKE
ncbi:MAG: hypothetical protein E7330_05965 [Clostridiales bacterium]|nr:hypothetical protein [Clostridiales bacterium]